LSNIGQRWWILDAGGRAGGEIDARLRRAMTSVQDLEACGQCRGRENVLKTPAAETSPPHTGRARTEPRSAQPHTGRARTELRSAQPHTGRARTGMAASRTRRTFGTADHLSQVRLAVRH
jgi:hypothetical protein